MSERIAPAIKRRDIVQVDEEHRTSWVGTVLSVKPTRKGWWVEVQDEDGYAYSVPLEVILLVEASDA